MTILKSSYYGAVWASICLLGLTTLFFMGPFIERQFFPVLSTFEFVPQGIVEDDGVLGRFHFVRDREDCTPAKENFVLIFALEDDVQKRVNYERVDLPASSPPTAFPKGPNLGELVRIDFFPYPDATEWLVILNYTCHPFWITKIRFDHLTIPEVPRS